MKRILLSVCVLTACSGETTEGSVEADAGTPQDAVDAAEVGEETEEEVSEPDTYQPECSSPIDCEDHVTCTQNVCNFGTCEYRPNAEFCDDSDACTIDLCNPKGNVFGGCEYKPKPCDDGDQCTFDVCDSVAGCTYTLQGGVCDDGDPCTNDLCEAATCQHLPVNCDDGDPKTFDQCSPQKGGCYHLAKQCDDGFPCAHEDPCMTGTCNLDFTCTFTKLNCADDISCTADVCAGGGCLFKPKDSLCQDNDGNVCTGQVCDINNGCVPAYVDCDDGKPYTLDVCNPEIGCVFTGIDDWCENANQCEDGQPCTIPVCMPDNTCSYVPKNCNDDITCTIDACDTNGNCINKPDDELCDDGEVCIEYGKKTGCVKGCKKASDCDDGLFCTVHICDYWGDFGEPNSCVLDPYDDNSDPCTAAAECDELNDECVLKEGYCESDKWCGQPEDPCSPSVCVDNFCVTQKEEDGVVCAQGACGTGTCADGACVTEEMDCDDFNPCTTDTCDEKIGCTHVPISDVYCDDNNACTANDICSVGWCTGAIALSCNDGLPCTLDSCDQAFGCIHAIVDPACGKNQCGEDNLWGCEPCNPVGNTCEDDNSNTLDQCLPYEVSAETFKFYCGYKAQPNGVQLKNGVGWVCPTQTVAREVHAQDGSFASEVEVFLANTPDYFIGTSAITVMFFNNESVPSFTYKQLTLCQCIDEKGYLALPKAVDQEMLTMTCEN